METSQTHSNSFLDNFWGPEDDEISTELQTYYLGILSRTEKLKAEITGYDFHQKDKKQYTAYKIHVTADYTEYDIHKRYSVFEQFRKQLMERYTELEWNKIPFPPKKGILNFFKIDTVEKTVKRQMALNEFLQAIVGSCKTLGIIELLDFLEMKERLKNTENSQAGYFPMDKSYATNSQEVAKLMQYLDLLNKNPDDTSKILKEMEGFYNTSRPRISPEIARAILVGKPKSQGLLHFCGKIGQQNNSHLICVFGLEFLAAFMDHQKCQDAEFFISAFGHLDLNTLGILNLTQHIEGSIKSTCKSYAMKLVDTYLSRNPKFTPNHILNKASALQEYEIWRKKNKTNSLMAEGYQVSGKFDETKEANDFSLSPTTRPVDQFDDATTDPEKMFPDKSRWVSLHKDDQIKIKYYKLKGLSINLKTSAGMEACAKETIKGIDFRIMCEESRTVKEIDFDHTLQLVKVKVDNPSYKYVAFMNERKIEENMGEATYITETPCKNYSVMLNNSEQLSKRISYTVIKYDQKSKGRKRKVKITIKNLDNYAMNLQEILIKKDGGKLLIDSCKKFLEDVERS